tara:strand:+ start:112 stop:438 length:327 start_codon:yes stop_codon:yes gene_type:complete
MSDTSPLFTKTSNVLKDITIVELQKNNDFLRNYIANKGDSPLYKYKVTIEAHRREMGSEWFPESEGIILSIENVRATVLYKDEHGRNKIINTLLKHIIITDDRVEKMF